MVAATVRRGASFVRKSACTKSVFQRGYATGDNHRNCYSQRVHGWRHCSRARGRTSRRRRRGSRCIFCARRNTLAHFPVTLRLIVGRTFVIELGHRKARCLTHANTNEAPLSPSMRSLAQSPTDSPATRSKKPQINYDEMTAKNPLAPTSLLFASRARGRPLSIMLLLFHSLPIPAPSLPLTRFFGHSVFICI